MALSHQLRLQELKALLIAAGYSESSNPFTPDSFRVQFGENDNIELTVSLPYQDSFEELPEALSPFAWTDDEVDRAIQKRVTEKQSWDGANFELALRSYLGELMVKHPDYIALMARVVSGEEGSPTMQEFETTKKRIQEELQKRPAIAEWVHKLETDYL
jgi:hypothetical protein